MDLLDELECMAQTAINQSELPDEPEYDDIKRWQFIFGLSFAQAHKEIQEHRADFSRPRVSDAHWEMVRVEKEAAGFDREMYEYSICGKAAKLLATRTTEQSQTYLLKLEGPMDDIEVVRVASQMKEVPPVYHGTDDDGRPASFCKVDATARNNILAYLSHHELRFQPTFVRYSRAAKNLSADSAYPTLGIDPTLPQHRLCSAHGNDPKLIPSQTQYPVWYFFYGTLADPAVLRRLLGVEPVYREASVQGGILTTWGGKYKALIDRPRGGVVHGSAFLVEDSEQEEILCCYETAKYEVVRCEIEMGDEKVRGLTFRFVP
ncbi:hypothetical protein F4778DRAFT_273656 [Xylariomycetidae sp. FL2044]|nr:hypothetical protein F4778DRAFT_273656 [Xylariomycetidae sp. FL2044]